MTAAGGELRVVPQCGAERCTAEASHVIKYGVRRIRVCERCKDLGLLIAGELGLVVVVERLQAVAS